MSTDVPHPMRGEVWRVDFDPTVGTELQKTRPAIVLSSDSVGKLPIKLVAPVSNWKGAFADNLWHIRIDPDPDNGLTKPSAADTLQVRGVDTKRFVAPLGRVTPAILDEIGAAIVAIIEFESEKIAPPLQEECGAIAKIRAEGHEQ